MSVDCKIREVEPRDVQALARLVTQLGYPVDAGAMGPRLQRLGESPGRTTWVAELDERVVGMIGSELLASYTSDATTARIVALVVDQELQGQGIGRALLRHAEAALVEAGAGRISLTTRQHRTEAHRFYEDMGYTKNGFRMVRMLPSPGENPETGEVPPP